MPKLQAILGIGALAAIGIGTWIIYPPAALIVVSALVWIDITRTR